MGVLVTSQLKFILASPAAYMTNKRTVFGVDINSMHSYIGSQTCLNPHTLSQEWHKLPVSCCRRTSIKSVCNYLLSWDLKWLASPAVSKQIPTIDVKNMFWLKSPGQRSSPVSEILISREYLILSTSNALQLSLISFSQIDLFSVICSQFRRFTLNSLISIYLYIYIYIYIYFTRPLA